ncbi:ArsR/SmtB family transcription factor [Streptomyces hirsutus]|uniref:ArsR/SmtB family transcription factor n=1 Tax=Streptomyces hirsutus TaxID=35620 RepID=UPI003630C95D
MPPRWRRRHVTRWPPPAGAGGTVRSPRPPSTGPAPPPGHGCVRHRERTAAMFKALGDPVRLRRFSAVASHQGGEACVCDISDARVSQPTVSHHLKKLKEAGLLTSERRGTWVYYRVEPSVMAAMGRTLAT